MKKLIAYYKKFNLGVCRDSNCFILSFKSRAKKVQI